MNHLKRWFLLVLCLCILSGCNSDWSDMTIHFSESPKTYASWFSYLDFHTLTEGKSLEDYTIAIDKILSNCETIGINTLYVQVSAFTDAMYNSNYYPTSMYASGKLGKKMDYDPFAVLIEQAKGKNIAIHAWINPFRSLTKKELFSLSHDYPIAKWAKDSTLAMQHLMLVDNRYYLNPGSSEAQNLILTIIQELCTNYDIAGIHIDDYFYPSNIDEQDAFTYNTYLQQHEKTSIDEYRREMVSTFVKNMYKTVKTVNQKFIVSISPSGNISYNFDTLYADVKTWVSSIGYCDVIVPQVYYGFDHSTCPFAETVDEWRKITSHSIDIIYGLAAYKVGEDDPYAGDGSDEWINNIDMLSQQVEYISKLSRYHGFALYRYGSLFHPKESIKQQMKLELSKLKPYLS